jgi:hypothetical protein
MSLESNVNHLPQHIIEENQLPQHLIEENQLPQHLTDESELPQHLLEDYEDFINTFLLQSDRNNEILAFKAVLELDRF